MRRLTLSRTQWEQMRVYVEAQAPLEACGLLGGRDGVVKTVIPVKTPPTARCAFAWTHSNNYALSSKLNRMGWSYWPSFIRTRAGRLSPLQPILPKRITKLFKSYGHPAKANGWRTPSG